MRSIRCGPGEGVLVQARFSYDLPSILPLPRPETRRVIGAGGHATWTRGSVSRNDVGREDHAAAASALIAFRTGRRKWSTRDRRPLPRSSTMAFTAVVSVGCAGFGVVTE
jgi:hypothetical protein